MDLLAPLKFPMARSYALTGPENGLAVRKGLANADWYRTPLDRKLLKDLMKRSDGPALRDTAIWLGLMLALAAGGIWHWGTWAVVPFRAAYGVLYATAADSRWPETPWAGLRLTRPTMCPHRNAPAFRAARIHIAIYALTVAAALWWGNWLPLMLIGLPRAYGDWLLLVKGLPQHMGLAEDVLDHRLNARSMIFGPMLRFLCRNMNDHVEHHMYPMVRYHALPRLHVAVRHDCPAPETLLEAWGRIIPTVLRQLKDPTHFIRKELPPGAGCAPEVPLAAR